MWTWTLGLACLLLAGGAHATTPVITMFYGDTQSWGAPGNPQDFVNLLGNVSDPDGIASLTYRLDGGPVQNLTVGPDTRRLLELGDFNVDIDYTTLSNGPHTVAITATDTLSNVAVKNVTLNYTAGQVWPEDDTVDWQASANPNEVGRVVDGIWQVDPNGVRPSVTGYDRTLSLGDRTWVDYEVTIPIVVNFVESPCCPFPSIAPGIGYVLRWGGHSELVPGEQPLAFWQPQGATFWYDYLGAEYFIAGYDGGDVVDTSGRLPTVGVTHNWKARAETLPSGETWFAFKVWDAALAEPLDWDLETTEVDTQGSGGILLVAHHVDATYGDVEIQSLATETQAPDITNVQVDVADNVARITWTTTEPAVTDIEYGLTAGYGTRITGSEYATEHSALLTDLTDSTTYHFQIHAEDQRTNAAATGDQTFVTLSSGAASFLIYDGFSSGTLDTGLWTWIDPLGDATLTLTGTHADISVPAGSEHSVWTDGNTLARLAQPLADDDFEVEVKFDSPVSGEGNGQGILIEQDSGNLIRVEFHQVGGNQRVFAASIFGATADIHHIGNLIGGITPPMYLRVTREGDDFTVAWSETGLNWTDAVTFNQPMTVTAASVYALNDGSSANVASVDYFLASVVTQASNVAQLNLTAAGNGTIDKNPDKAIYTIGESVQLTANPTGGATFTGWTGDVVSALNPVNVVLGPTNSITANFSGGVDITPPVISNVQAIPAQTQATVQWDTDEPATSTLDYGTSPGGPYPNQVSDASLVTFHSLVAGGLTADTTYYYVVTSEDAATNSATSAEFSFTTPPLGGGGQGPISDDFSQTALDPVWTYVNPFGDGVQTMTGTEVQIALPANGVFHEPWVGAIDAPRVSQDIDDVSFEVEVKFTSPMPLDGQIQGILIEEDDQNFIRIDFHTLAGSFRAFAGTVIGPSGVVRAVQDMPMVSPMWLRVTRVGDTFTVKYSQDGAAFPTLVTFNQPLTVDQISVFAGNDDVTAHAMTADYFFDTASPIVPEDGYLLTTNVVGPGTVDRFPNEQRFAPGTDVTLTAIPDAGFAFDQWSGDATGSVNPLVVTINADTTITATFVDGTPPVISNLQASAAGPNQVAITWTTDEPATSVVDWGTALPYSNHDEDLTLKTAHLITLTGVPINVEHHYEVTSQDAAGNPALSGDLTFTLVGNNRCGLIGIEMLFAWPLAGLLGWRPRRRR